MSATSTSWIHEVIQCNIRDITERKRAERQIRRLYQILGTLSDVNQTIVRVDNREDLFRDVCRIAVERGGFKLVGIHLIAEDGVHVEPVMQCGAPGDYLAQRNIILDDPQRNQAPTGQAILTGQSKFCFDVATDHAVETWREDALNCGIRASAAVPLRFGGRVAGSLDLFADNAGYFDDEGVKLLEEMALDISFALENLERERQREEAEQQHQAAEARFRAIFEQTALGMALTALDGTHLDCNTALLDMLGITKEEFVSLPSRGIHPSRRTSPGPDPVG